MYADELGLQHILDSTIVRPALPLRQAVTTGRYVLSFQDNRILIGHARVPGAL